MSELKAFDVGIGRYTEDGYPCVVAFDADQNPRLLDEKVYLKSEADKVIAKKDKEIERQNTEIKNAVIDLKLRDKKNDKLSKELRHQKYKRCLAMTRWCKMSAIENDTRMCLPDKQKFTKHEEYLYFIGYYHKWYIRWLELAEKFKE